MGRMKKLLLFFPVLVTTLAGCESDAAFNARRDAEHEQVVAEVSAKVDAEMAAIKRQVEAESKFGGKKHEPEKSDGKISLSEYREVEIGMSRGKVFRILGSTAQTGEQTTAEGTLTRYEWRKPLYSHVTAMFRDNVLISIEQTGLD